MYVAMIPQIPSSEMEVNRPCAARPARQPVHVRLGIFIGYGLLKKEATIKAAMEDGAFSPDQGNSNQ